MRDATLPMLKLAPEHVALLEKAHEWEARLDRVERKVGLVGIAAGAEGMTTARIILAGGILLGIFGLLAASLFFPLQGVAVQIEDVLLGAFCGAFTVIISFYFRRS